MAETGAKKHENGCGARGEVRGRCSVTAGLAGGYGRPRRCGGLYGGVWPMESVENCVEILTRFLYTCSLPPFPQALTVESVENRPRCSRWFCLAAVYHPSHSLTVKAPPGGGAGVVQYGKITFCLLIKGSGVRVSDGSPKKPREHCSRGFFAVSFHDRTGSTP